jgi:DNA polymerase-4
VIPDHAEKSIGAETTFDVDVSDLSTIRRAMLALSEKVARRLRAAGQAGRTVSVKIRLADFQTLSRSRTVGVPTDVSREIFEIGWSLFQSARPGERIRLVGVRVEGLVHAEGAPRQMTLGERDHGWRDAERAADAVAARFGSDLVKPASLLRGDAMRTDGNGAAPVRDGAEASQRRHNGRTKEPPSSENRHGRTIVPLSDGLTPS